VSDHNPSQSLDQEIAQLEETCRQAAQAISNARSVREAFEAGQVEVPHHLLAIARARVPSLGRLPRAREQRVEEIVKDQLTSLRMEHSDFVASRELDRWKATDWSYLRSDNPDLFAKALREANLIIEHKRKNRR